MENNDYLEKYTLKFFKLNNEVLQHCWGGDQNLERRNVERPIFRNFKITSIKIAKDKLFGYFIYELFIYLFFQLLEHSKYLIIFPNYRFLNKKITNISNFGISLKKMKK